MLQKKLFTLNTMYSHLLALHPESHLIICNVGREKRNPLWREGRVNNRDERAR